MIVGNKVDKEFGRVVSTEEGEAFARSRNPPWLFVSQRISFIALLFAWR